MKGVLFICLLGLANLSHALNLQLAFNETTFEINTTGTFHLTGEFSMGGNPGSNTGSDGIVSYTLGTQYRGSNTATLPIDYYFTLHGHSATGTAIRSGITHNVVSNAIWVQIFNAKPVIQVYVGPTPSPADDPFASTFVNITGSFTVNSNMNSGQSPASQGIAFDNLAGTYNSGEYDPSGTFTITVPEPSTLSLFSLAVIPPLLRRRHS